MISDTRESEERQAVGKKSDDRRGPAAFDRYFQEVYGDRWPALRRALEGPGRPESHLDGLLKPYFLDGASVRAARALGVQPGDTVLDMCAAPGGKTLVLALALAGSGLLVSNDRSADRRSRLKRVVEEHLPVELRSVVTVTGYDATRWGLHEQGVYDKILLDAPCSSERHLVHSPAHLAQWSPNRTKSLAQQALAMLCAALEALKPGGRLLYSTCSISPEENQDLLERFSSKREGRWVLVEQNLDLPDTADGEGPLFRALIEKS
jgi:16S rRNA C967 or C1407 C5-methylase (RsmB/RsmF family)